MIKKYKWLYVIILFFCSLFLITKNVNSKNAISHNKDGWNYLNRGDNFKAIFSFKNSLKQNAKFKKALLGLGKAYYEVEAYDQALDLFSEVLKIDANSVEALVGLGFTFVNRGNGKDALIYFNRAIEISDENIEARYGIAYLYNAMGKKIWAKRKLDNILRIDPYHYDSLLLLAEIKSSNNDLKKARQLIEKAIDSNSDNPKGYIKYGEILFRDYLKNENDDYLAEASHSFKNALSIQPKSFHANKQLGNISLVKEDYSKAILYYKRALKDIENSFALYSLAISYDLNGDKDNALINFLKTMKIAPTDSILRSRLEDFFIFNDYKIGHPARIMLNKEHYNLAVISEKNNLPDDAVMYLRRSILLNPMYREARERIMDYYSILDYNRFYINEVKEMMRLYPDNKYRDRLNVAVIKRRERLYHREGYSFEVPSRDVPRVLVLNFDIKNNITAHPDAGEVIGSNLTFVLSQFGRMTPVGLRKRTTIVKGLKGYGNHLEESLEKISNKIKTGNLKPIDYIVYGNYAEIGNRLSIECNLLDFNKGFIIGKILVSESGKECLPKLALRTARSIYNIIPFKGSILKLKENGIIVNLGLFDGIKPGEKIIVNKYNNPDFTGGSIKKKLIFTIKEADTLISYAIPEKISELKEIDSNEIVLPLKRRRARLIE